MVKTFFMKMDDDLHMRVKVAAALENKTMRELLIDMVIDRLGDNKKLK